MKSPSPGICFRLVCEAPLWAIPYVVQVIEYVRCLSGIEIPYGIVRHKRRRKCEFIIEMVDIPTINDFRSCAAERDYMTVTKIGLISKDK